MDTMTPEALSNALNDIFEFKLDFEIPITYISRNDDTVTKTRIHLNSLFADPEQYKAAGELLLQLIIHDTNFQNLAEFITQWSNNSLAESTLKGTIVPFETYIKNIIGIIDVSARSEMDRTRGLRNVTDTAKTRYNLIGATASETFETLRIIGNNLRHGNESASDIIKQKDSIAAIFFASLLHIVSRAIDPLNKYLAEKKAPAGTGPVNEDEIIKDYVRRCRQSYASYLENNVLHGEDAKVSPIPLMIKELEGKENPEEALGVLKNAPDGKYIILGVPGAGKTTLLNSYLLGISNAFASGEGEMVPVLICASDVEKDQNFIDTLLSSAAAKGLDKFTAKKMLDEGRVAIAIDGINEFHPDVNVDKFLKDVMQNSTGRLIMTGRIYEYASVKRTIDEYGKPRIFQVQDISSETIREFVGKLNFDEEKSHHMLDMFFNNDRIFSLLSCPLNLKILIDTITGDNSDFRFRNRGGLISAFVDEVCKRENDKDRIKNNSPKGPNKIYRAEWLLENLALRIAAEGTVSIDDFAADAVAEDPNIYVSKENVLDKIIEPLVRVGILKITNDTDIQFKLDTFREYFLARIYAASFSASLKRQDLRGRRITELPSINDNNNNETFRLMLELMETDSACSLAEKLYADRCGERIPVELKPEMFIGKANYALAWICDLVRTLDAADMPSAERPDAKTLCSNWVVNTLKILLQQKKDAAPKVYDIITQAGASLCTERVIRFMTGDRWIDKMLELGLAQDWASIIAARASDARLVYRILSKILPNYRYKDHKIGAVLRDLHRKLLYGMNTLQLELLHRDIARRIAEFEDKSQSVPAEIYADYYLTALLTTNINLIKAVPAIYVRRAAPAMKHGDYDRLLGAIAAADNKSDALVFFAHRTEKYEADISLLIYVIKYLAGHHNEEFAAALLHEDSFIQIIYSESVLREICAQLPIRLIPIAIADRLYESSLLKIALKSADENNFSRNLKRIVDDVYATVVNDNLYFDIAAAKAQPDIRKCNAKILSIDGKNTLSIVCATLAKPNAYVGTKAVLSIGTASTLEGTVEKCEAFSGDYFEMVFGFRGIPVGNLCGRLDWVNSELQRKGWLEYSMCVCESNTLMLRFTNAGAMNQLNKKEVREALASPLTVFRIKDKLHIPLRSIRYPKIQNGTRISIRLDKPLPINDKSLLCIEKIMMTDADGNNMPLFQQNYVEGSNKSTQRHSLFFFRDRDSCDAKMLFSQKNVRHVCPGLWISAAGCNYHALVKNDAEIYGNVLECADFELSCREIPPCGSFSVDKADLTIKYVVRENDSNGKYRLFLLTDKASAEKFSDIANRYPKLIFSDGSNGILQHAPETTDHGGGILIELSLRGANDDVLGKWTATPVVDFNVLRSVLNECKVRNTIYTSTAIPYLRRKDGKIEIPVPVNAKYLNGIRVYVNDRSRKSLPCTIHPLGSINTFAKTIDVQLRNPAGIAPKIDRDRGFLFIEKGSWLEYRNILNVVQFDSGRLYHPDMVRPVIEAMIQNDDTEIDETRMKFFRDSMSEPLLMLYDVTRAQLLKYKADEQNG